ncbi:MAG: sigma-54-dependent Fis family transcriptional regulator [Lysobacterales bacterium]
MPTSPPIRGVSTARHRFFEGGESPAGLVPSVIEHSWQRCAALGLPSRARPEVEPMPASALHHLRDRYDALIRACRPEIEALYSIARSNGSIAILTGPDGMVLDALGDATFLDKAARVSLRPGVPWREDATGTNAIGTAMIEQRPVEVRGPEHYFERHRILSCSAMPIRDPMGRLAGVLDLSGEASVHHVHALGMVQFAVDQIEHRMFEALPAGTEILRLHTDATMIGTAREGLLVFDGNRLVGANRHALAMLGLGWEALGHRMRGDVFPGAWPGIGRNGVLRDLAGEPLHVRLERQAARRGTVFLPPATSRAPTVRDNPQVVLDDTLRAEIDRAVRLLNAGIPLLVQGETGCGKEVFAREVHRRSSRGTGPFVAINCAALPESLIESELFGYAPGAFTGARREGSPGLLKEANGGVLFLDEIGDMPLALQSRLLRVLQDREVTPLGGGRAAPLDVAVIAASHRDVRAAAEGGEFRPDLFYRIAQSVLRLPPLRDHADRRRLVGELWRSLGMTESGVDLGADTIERLAACPWPGNFRQLVGVLRTLAALADPGTTIGVDALAGLLDPAEPVASHGGAGTPAGASLDAISRDAMQRALAANGGNVSAAARQLGVNRSTLYRRLGMKPTAR